MKVEKKKGGRRGGEERGFKHFMWVATHALGGRFKLDGGLPGGNSQRRKGKKGRIPEIMTGEKLRGGELYKRITRKVFKRGGKRLLLDANFFGCF